MQRHAWAGLALGKVPWQSQSTGLPPYENCFSCLNGTIHGFVWLTLSLPKRFQDMWIHAWAQLTLGSAW